jgi:hypothetical protein
MLLPLLVPLVAVSGAANGQALPKPCSDEKDWVQLSSAEWLRGDLRRMRGKRVEFKSKKLKSQTLKWKDVVELCLPRVARWVREGPIVTQGLGHMAAGEVVVVTANGEVRFPRRDLVAVLPGEASELERWGVKLTLGLDAHVGNTEQTAYSASGEIWREAHSSRFLFGYQGSVGTADGQENVNKHRLNSFYDYFFTKRFYWTVIDAIASYDRFQNIGIRFTPSTGPGYMIVDRPNLDWRVAAALGYQYTSFISVAPGEAASTSDLAVVLSTEFEWEIVNDFKFNLSNWTILVPTDFDQTSLRTRGQVTYEITDLLRLEITAIHDFLNQPVSKNDGTVPDSHDFQLILGLGVEIW